jgi:hypothetical protein
VCFISPLNVTLLFFGGVLSSSLFSLCLQRTYSDYHFFGRLQALRQPALVREVTGGLVGKEGAEAFVQQLSPKAFDARVHEEIAELQRCFVDLPDGRLIWKPPPVKKRLRWDCEVIDSCD